MHRLDFLPYHFLLTSIGEGGVLRYQVTFVSTYNTVICALGKTMLPRVYPASGRRGGDGGAQAVPS